VRDDGKPAHIGETLPAKMAAGNPEGSPSDPLTTDPKGDGVSRFGKSENLCDMQYAGPHSSKWHLRYLGLAGKG
jgi:hypothetical protein